MFLFGNEEVALVVIISKCQGLKTITISHNHKLTFKISMRNRKAIFYFVYIYINICEFCMPGNAMSVAILFRRHGLVMRQIVSFNENMHHLASNSDVHTISCTLFPFKFSLSLLPLSRSFTLSLHIFSLPLHLLANL